MRRGDYMRAVVTDTLPEEVPIIFSNDGFYKNLTGGLPETGPEREFSDILVDGPDGYTIPYRYNVLRDQFRTRGLSLLHPAAQHSVTQFYSDYDALICYYARQSEFSLRSPRKVGSTYFIRGIDSNRNRYRSHTIDTVSMEKSVSNPASYFAYDRTTRAHQFFDSNEYLHLEKKFEVFRMLDVAKCFNSIYTHTISWAVSDIKTSKDNTSASTFGNDFDRLMQRMNYNETNGICIGPEVSRVFAEIIFSDVDRITLGTLTKSGLSVRSDYDVRRYIDDYYIFAASESVADKVAAAIQSAMSKFNLHLNHQKTRTIRRPFTTPKSEIISSVNMKLNAFFSKFISYHLSDTTRFAKPKRILRSDALIRSFVSDVKASCMMHNTSYHMVSDYIVSALQKRVIDLSDSYQLGSISNTTDDEYIAALMLLIECSYFFYTVNPTVRASLNLARSNVVASRLVSAEMPDRLNHLSETIVRWTIDLAKSLNNGGNHRSLTAISVELLNVLLPMKEIAENEPLVDVVIGRICEDIPQFEYFEIVSLLYILGDARKHRDLRRLIFNRAKEIISRSLGPKIDSQAAHICLDLLSCPHLPLDKRASWFNSLRSRCGLPRVPRAQSQAAVRRMESHPWFVQWSGLDLLSVLTKKELSIVY